ncbi:uncharacterized protein BT62DRAFT_1004391 [Guyanagaster necrorhizus]|uniref:RRM domain-containing protein n=1 Tax=Guyanagaster necrorhizus TaxID=856835 RepID=A0A9P8ATP2_9AGAR|nr:uncharacterized protein BT62DRAFT_1004391 [Guyanagaster necrorhizus MCA 3950]KAG7447633.1 hypothetical protein BT62DRAFT_1004391 [Guyanagaster necrorhizus MCA 3950]
MNVVREINAINEAELRLGVSGSWHDTYKDSAYIYVGGLNYELTEGDVITIFSQYGEVANVHLPRDKATGKQRGFGFLMYEDQRSTVLAVDNLNGAKVLGKTLRVDHVRDYKQPKEKGEDGEWREVEGEQFNARPQDIVDDEGEEEEEEEDLGKDIDPEDPMREFIIEQRRKKKRKHEGETREERRKRKKEKRKRKSAAKDVEALLDSLKSRHSR